MVVVSVRVVRRQERQAIMSSKVDMPKRAGNNERALDVLMVHAPCFVVGLPLELVEQRPILEPTTPRARGMVLNPRTTGHPMVLNPRTTGHPPPTEAQAAIKRAKYAEPGTFIPSE